MHIWLETDSWQMAQCIYNIPLSVAEATTAEQADL
jgi:hypothetical protein